jgi:chitinase
VVFYAPVLLLLLLLLSPFASAATRIVAYVDKDTNIPRIGAQKLTHVNYAFALISRSGEVVLQPVDVTRLQQLRALKARNRNLKIILSVGGAGANGFSDAALTAASRTKFAVSARTLVTKHGLDGIDVDWEYPGTPGRGGLKFRREDKRNFTLLLGELRRVLGTGRILTIASSGDDYFQHAEMHRLHEHLDWINIMAYDFAGAWTPRTGHQSGLYWNPKAGPKGPSVNTYVKQHLAAGIPRDKLVLGVPFHGRVWKGVRKAHRGFNQPYKSAAPSIPWSGIRAQKGFKRYWDEVASVPYLWNQRAGTFISYDDPESLRWKVWYVKKQRLGGVMYWLHRHDPNEELLDVIVKRLRE